MRGTEGGGYVVDGVHEQGDESGVRVRGRKEGPEGSEGPGPGPGSACRLGHVGAFDAVEFEGGGEDAGGEVGGVGAV